MGGHNHNPHGHGHNHRGHSHGPGGHHHGVARGDNRRKLLVVLAMAAVYMVAEAVAGWLTNSLALLADAGHMLSDVASLALSFFAMWAAERPATLKRTYGYYRAEILAALVNAATLIAIAFFVFFEAYQRLSDPPEVQGAGMLAVATGGLLVNLIGLRLLHSGKDESLNLRGAWLHVATDALGSVGAMLSAALIWAYGWYLADPLVSFFIGLLVLYSSWGLLRESVSVLMESAPRHIDVDDVRNAIRGIDGVCSVHDLHVWSITSGMVALSVHVGMEKERPRDDLLQAVRRTVHDRFGIDHTTVQVEPANFGDCGSGDCGPC